MTNEHKTSELKTCTKCKIPKPVEEFYREKNQKDGRNYRCIPCYKEIKAENISSIRSNRRAWERRLRQEVINHYGGRCACCKEETYEFLAIDHIEGDGRKHRLSINTTITQWLKRNGFPKGFRILCHNCNMAKGRYGYCPHEPLI